jgi:DEAD/DEAH box helicase domain-containing protein
MPPSPPPPPPAAVPVPRAPSETRSTEAREREGERPDLHADPPPPWQQRARGVSAVMDDWLAQGKVKPCLAFEKLIPARPAKHADMLESVHPRLVTALAERGVQRLYSHQAIAIAAAQRREHTVIATPTSSGKSLCFHLPVLTELARTPTSSALYLYPTKALSRDQEHDLRALIASSKLGFGAMVFDGDTRGDARKAVREQARVVLTNPDMLHAGIMPNHTKWASFFEGLKYVVIDELHTYRGVFGSHMAHVLARLRRLARFHGADPTFICATATIGNPREHAARLIGCAEDAITLVEESGAPSASRRVLIYNPPIVDEALQLRGSALKHAVNLTVDLIRARVPSIVFGESRNSVEIMLKYLRERCADVADGNALMAYRGGYLPETRRAIEQGLRDGNILCVVATNALELGIDIGDLDAVVCVGFPGSIASLWQRFGRAGRRGSQSIALMVCSSRALDQYLAREPDYVLQRGAEEARIDPSNPEIVVQHLKCATFEAPFQIVESGSRPAHPEPASGETYATLDVGATRDALDYLVDQGLVHSRAGKYSWTGEAYPASHVSLRSIGWDNFVIIDQETNKSLAELDWRASHTMLHEQAIYQHDAEQYQVERLDYENHKAYVRKVAPDYFTTALTYRNVEVIEEFEQRSHGHSLHGFGEVKVLEKVTGYKKIKFNTHENAGYGDVHLPEMQMHTTAFWLTLSEAVITSMDVARAQVIDALRAMGLAFETACTLALMCEPQDINRTLGNGYDESGAPPGRSREQRGEHDPTLFLFDALPGGVGLAKRIYHRAPELLRSTARLIESCPCVDGCPACIGPADNRGTRKRLALRLATLAVSGA